MFEKPQQSRVSILVAIKRQQVSNGIAQREHVCKGNEACWIMAKRKVRMDAVKEEDKWLIYDYFTHQASHATGSKKDKMCQQVWRTTHVVDKRCNHNISTQIRCPFRSPSSTAMQIFKLMERKALKTACFTTWSYNFVHHILLKNTA